MAAGAFAASSQPLLKSLAVSLSRCVDWCVIRPASWTIFFCSARFLTLSSFFIWMDRSPILFCSVFKASERLKILRCILKILRCKVGVFLFEKSILSTALRMFFIIESGIIRVPAFSAALEAPSAILLAAFSPISPILLAASAILSPILSIKPIIYCLFINSL